MSFVVGVQTVNSSVLEVLHMLVHQGEESTQGIEVDDGYCPYVTCFFDSVDIALQGFTATVVIVFRGLPVLVVGIETRTVDGGDEHDLLRRVGALQLIQCDIDASLIGVCCHDRVHPLPGDDMFLLMDTCHHFLFPDVIPLSDGHSVIEVVGTDEDQDSIHLVTMLCFQLVGLVGNVVPLPAADAIDVWGDAQPVLQIVPVLDLRSIILRVGDGVSKISHTLVHPGMCECVLCHHGEHRQPADGKGDNPFFHCIRFCCYRKDNSFSS